MEASFKPDPEQMFNERLSNAPLSVKLLFDGIKSRFQQRNDSFPHHTRTNGGDLRLAIPGHLLGQKKLRNFGTLSWRPRLQMVKGRTYLPPEEMKNRNIQNTAKPKKPGEPLLSDFWLSEDECLNATQNIIDAMEAARSKMMSELMKRDL